MVDDGRVKLLLVGVALSLFALVGVSALGLLAAVSALAQPSPATPLLFVLLDAVMPYVLAAALLGGLSFLLLVWLSVAAVRRASMPRNDRLARVARRIERHYPAAREVGLSERVEPTTEERIEELKRQYVEGDLSELEYERRLQDLLGEEGVSDERVRREQSRTEFEFER